MILCICAAVSCACTSARNVCAIPHATHEFHLPILPQTEGICEGTWKPGRSISSSMGPLSGAMILGGRLLPCCPPVKLRKPKKCVSQQKSWSKLRFMTAIGIYVLVLDLSAWSRGDATPMDAWQHWGHCFDGFRRLSMTENGVVSL